MTKLAKIENKSIDLEKLAHQIKKLLAKEKFKVVKDDSTENAIHIRAVKDQITRIVIGTAREVELVIAGDPNNFALVLVVGAWGKNIAISATAGYVIASTVAAPAVAAGTILAAGSYLSAVNFEEEFFEKILKEIAKLKQSFQDMPNQ